MLRARTELGTFAALKKGREERQHAGAEGWHALDISLHLLKGMESSVGMMLARGGVQGWCCLGEMLSQSLASPCGTPGADVSPCLVSPWGCLSLSAGQDPSPSHRAAPGALQQVMTIMRPGPEDGKGGSGDATGPRAVLPALPRGQTQLWLRPLAPLPRASVPAFLVLSCATAPRGSNCVLKAGRVHAWGQERLFEPLELR